jgi:hypothetical protein
MNLAQLGKVTPPETIPTVPPGTENIFVAGLIRNGIYLLLVASFVLALIFTIIAGIRFVVSGSDEKAVASAWGQSIITNFKLTP